ncbi:MAG: hypothetical protein K5756_02245 [Clostridiales bacterium]|nr:hypothetical protein [Clostridiales bacterium]
MSKKLLFMFVSISFGFLYGTASSAICFNSIKMKQIAAVTKYTAKPARATDSIADPGVFDSCAFAADGSTADEVKCLTKTYSDPAADKKENIFTPRDDCLNSEKTLLKNKDKNPAAIRTATETASHIFVG